MTHLHIQLLEYLIPPPPSSSQKRRVQWISGTCFSNALSHHCTVAWVTRPEHPKDLKDVIKQGSEGP